LSGGSLSASGSSSRVSALAPFFDSGAGTYQAAVVDGGALTTQALNANQIRLIAFVPDITFTIDQVGLSISTLAAGSNIRILVYSSHATTRRPETLLMQSTDISGGAAGTIFVNQSFTFTEGTLYWIGVHSSGTPTIRIAANTAVPMLTTTNAATPVLNRCLVATETFGSPPATWTYSTAQPANSGPPYIIFRRA
jgi:hypothetical protein